MSSRQIDFKLDLRQVHPPLFRPYLGGSQFDEQALHPFRLRLAFVLHDEPCADLLPVADSWFVCPSPSCR